MQNEVEIGGALHLLMQGVWWASYLLIPLALGGLYLMARARRWSGRLGGLVLAVLALPLSYARFVEPARLVTAEHALTVCGGGLPGTLRAGVVSDFHYGPYRRTPGAARVVSALNAARVDIVLMPGDFADFLTAEEVAAALGPFSALQAPAFAVLGNHDHGFPGDDGADAVIDALEEAGVTVLDPGEAVFEHAGKFLRLVGFRDLKSWRERGIGPLGPTPRASRMPTIGLAHSPATLEEKGIGALDLMVSGHTHGGQVNLPWATCALTKACDTLRYGYADTHLGKVFVTSGIGTSRVPLRFGVPPRVDVLNITLDRCRPKALERLQNMHPHEWGSAPRP